MFIHVDERRAWVRLATHTVVFEGDPEYEAFSRDPSGEVKRRLRFWLAEGTRERPHLRAYLGSIVASGDGPLLSEVLRLLRRVTDSSDLARESPATLRRKVFQTLKGCALP